MYGEDDWLEAAYEERFEVEYEENDDLETWRWSRCS